MRARRFPPWTPLRSHLRSLPCWLSLTLTIGKKLSSKLFDVCAIFILCLWFALKKPEIPCVIKLFDCLVNIIGTVLSLSPDPYWKIRTIWFDFETAEVIEKKKNCIDPLLKMPSDSLFGLNPIYIFSCPVDAAATDFFRFETAAFEICEPIKVMMTRDPCVKTFWFRY